MLIRSKMVNSPPDLPIFKTVLYRLFVFVFLSALLNIITFNSPLLAAEDEKNYQENFSLSSFNQIISDLSNGLFSSRLTGILSSYTIINTTPAADNTAPVISLKSNSRIEIQQGESYQEAGATATDDRDGTLSVTITGTVDTAIAGTYTLSYTATDQAGNTTTVSRSIIINATTTQQTEIIITNSKLQQCLREQFGHMPSETELQAMTRFECKDKGLTNSDINELSKLTQLTALGLYNNQISDISVLSGLTQLTFLNLGINKISDISVLSGLTQLTYLGLHTNNISDISVLSGLTQLNDLKLGINQISDISVLSGLTQLNDLKLGSNQISDISALSGLTQLNSLDLNSNQISDISVLSGLTQLNDLRLGANQISDISVLSELIQLNFLMFDDNQISDISPLISLIGLNNPPFTFTFTFTFGLQLSLNCISDFSAISHLTSVYGKDQQNLNCTNSSALARIAIAPLKNAIELSNQGLIISIRDASGNIVTDSSRYRIVSFDSNSTLGGTIIDKGDLSFAYTAPTTWLETDHFSYSLLDQSNNISNTATVNIVPIVASDDAVTLQAETVINVLANDLNLTGSDIAIHAFDSQSIQGGTITQENNQLIYTPKSGFSGTDSFTYKIQTASAYLPTENILIDNGLRAVNKATVTLTVQSNSSTGETRLVANNDEVRTTEGENISLNVLTNDQGVNDVISFTHPQNGSLVNQGAGQFIYTPNANFIGRDTFTYTITDGNGNRATATVNVNIDGAGGTATVGAGSMEGSLLWLLLVLYCLHLGRQYPMVLRQFIAQKTV